MTRRQRLRGHARFAAVRSAGVEGRAGGVRVRVVRHADAPSRAGFAVRGASGAVERNRCRRRLRAATGRVLASRPGYDIVVSVVATSPEPAFSEIVSSLERAVTRAVDGAERQ
ncbi:MAG: ribonuclease P protein component [Candidatus Dormibacteraeota bacterium]|nr:ribonuclease P protein component [Candidatus Dormibacteraeota bacterium]